MGWFSGETRCGLMIDLASFFQRCVYPRGPVRVGPAPRRRMIDSEDKRETTDMGSQAKGLSLRMQRNPTFSKLVPLEFHLPGFLAKHQHELRLQLVESLP